MKQEELIEKLNSFKKGQFITVETDGDPEGFWVSIFKEVKDDVWGRPSIVGYISVFHDENTKQTGCFTLPRKKDIFLTGLENVVSVRESSATEKEILLEFLNREIGLKWYPGINQFGKIGG